MLYTKTEGINPALPLVTYFYFSKLKISHLSTTKCLSFILEFGVAASKNALALSFRISERY
jgi:hypothetical protein